MSSDLDDALDALHEASLHLERAPKQSEITHLTDVDSTVITSALDWTWSRIERSINSIRTAANNGPPTVREFQYGNETPFHSQTLIQHFGKWRNALYASGYPYAELNDTETYTDDECLTALKEAADQLDSSKLLTSQRYSYMRDSPHLSTIVSRFGTWNNAKRAADLPIAPDHYTEQEALCALYKVTTHVSGRPTMAEYNTHCTDTDPNATTITLMFDGWNEAVDRAEEEGAPQQAAGAD